MKNISPNILARLDELERLDDAGIEARLDEIHDLAKRHAWDFDFRQDGDPRNARWDFSAHMDANESLFIARQLEFIREELFYIQYPELKAKLCMPWNMDIDPGVEQFTARAVDLSGNVQIQKDQSDDVPMVEMKVTSATGDLFSFAFGYAYSDQEARNAMYARMPLPAMKAKACREIMARKMDDLAFMGDSTGVTSILGLFTLPTTGGNTVSVAAATQTSATNDGTWETKPTDDVIRDLNQLGNQIVSNTNETTYPDTWMLPLTAYNYINERRIGDGTTKPILKYFLKNNEYVKAIHRSIKLEATRVVNGATTNAPWGAVRRAVAYKNDKTRFEHLVPMEFVQKMPQFAGFKVKTFCEMRTGGLAVYVPQSICYMTTF